MGELNSGKCLANATAVNRHRTKRPFIIVCGRTAHTSKFFQKPEGFSSIRANALPFYPPHPRCHRVSNFSLCTTSFFFSSPPFFPSSPLSLSYLPFARNPLLHSLVSLPSFRFPLFFLLSPLLPHPWLIAVPPTLAAQSKHTPLVEALLSNALSLVSRHSAKTTTTKRRPPVS